MCLYRAWHRLGPWEASVLKMHNKDLEVIKTPLFVSLSISSFVFKCGCLEVFPSVRKRRWLSAFLVLRFLPVHTFGRPSGLG